jgi:hypothetical protein
MLEMCGVSEFERAMFRERVLAALVRREKWRAAIGIMRE